MKTIVKAIKWAYSDWASALVFIFGMLAVVVGLQAFIAYPIQIIAAVIIGFAAYCIFTLVSEWNR